MGVCNLMSPLLWQSVPFADNDAFLDFLGVHSNWHRVLADATRTQFLLTDDLKRELLRHSEMHSAVARSVGLSPPYDLVSYQLGDRESYYGFMATHALDHQRLRVALGI